MAAVDADPRHLPPRLWLALSGGGFRAALFHYGCLKRLHEAGILHEVLTNISATSGGSFITALLRCHRGSAITGHQFKWEEFERKLLNIVIRGVLGPTTALVAAYVLYVAAAVSFYFAFYPAAALSATSGVATHLGMVGVLLADGAHKPRRAEVTMAHFDSGYHAPGAKLRIVRFIRMALIPSETRWQTLNVRAYDGAALTRLGKHVYLTATELESQQEWIFSNNVVSPLNDGTSKLWKNHAGDSCMDTRLVPLALAVAASSAFPPIFRPVRIAARGKTWWFVDGGVIDNLAARIPLALSVDIHRQRGRFGDEPFDTRYKGIFFLDGGAARPRSRNSRRLGRLRGLLRIVDTFGNEQRNDMAVVVGHFNRNTSTRSRVLALWQGLVDSAALPAALEPDRKRLGTLLRGCGRISTASASLSVHCSRMRATR
jgi:predicted acylesterase/phospholipase RssA